MSHDIDALQKYSLDQLRNQWLGVFEEPASRYASRDFLIQNLSYREQEKQQGGLREGTRRRLNQLYQTFKENPDYRPPASRAPLKAGTRLIRQWQGKVHSVTVLANAFEYLDEEYKSLSAIARLITGTRWSGPVFFGLKKSGNHVE